MSEDKKTNEELLEEVKKLRKIEEDRDKKKEDKKRNEFRAIGGCSLMIALPVIIFIVFALINS